jgi:hypothetical protein
MRIFLSKKFILFTIVIVAFFLRSYKFSSIPPALSWDEVSIGYNAYSILKTARDEHGKVLPLDTFIGYGDYKPPFSVYVTVPFIAIFGLNETSVRLPSALFGTLTVLLTYFLVKELFSSSKNPAAADFAKAMTAKKALADKQELTRNYELGTTNLPIIASLLLAISPWHINLSRAGFEANIAFCFIVLGVLFVLKARSNPKMWIVAWIPFVVSIYTFNSSRYFAPFLAIPLIYMSFKSMRKNIRYVLIGIGLSLLLVLPLVPHLLSKEARLRYTEVNIFSDPSIVITANRRIEEAGSTWWAKIVFNRRVGYARSYALHFLDHFQPDFLFIKGDGNPKFSIQDVGQLYSIEAPFLVIGIFGMLLTYPSIALLLLYWLLAAIIPAAVARETPHALRILNSLPTWHIFIAYGIWLTGSWVYQLRHNGIKRQTHILLVLYYVTIISLYIFNVGYYLHNYYVHYPKEFSGEWQYGYKQAIEYIQTLKKNYDTVYMTESIGRPYMYTLFYTHMDSNEFFQTKNASFDDAGFYHVYGIGKFKFVKDMPESCTGSCLYIDQAGAPVGNVTILKTIYLLNGIPVLKIYEK